MIIVAQRVSSSSVTVGGKIVGSINKGLMLLVGVHKDDTEAEADFLAAKCADLRIFNDENGKMNLSLKDIGGEALVISQFTLLGNCSKGRRPNFTAAAPAEKGRALYEYFVKKLKEEQIRKVETGIFGADMKVQLVNDGPVTIVINS
ncbi:MAG: D-tyrosyl-tRNA(Tyr) deacylase [Chitinispirillales bacterium]|jgi:D-tyrosyl-tRNA(Tyr) deacylase|nr:D-tyrosyl-tRNA(Tyr) deacylase [Chitinispirillales bacterium]